MNRLLTAAVWGLSWAGFSGAWAIFLSLIVPNSEKEAWVLFIVMTAVSVLLLSPLVYQNSKHSALVKVTAYGAKAALFVVIAAALLFRPAWSFQTLLAGLGVYFAPLALGLSGVALRLGWPGSGANAALRAAVVFLIGGMILLFPIPPISTGTYNPVGLFFPVWGWGAPTLVSAWGMWRMSRQRGGTDEATEGQV
ncbi:MAG: hypothetical protein AB1497_01475 [Bacillota bacterium]